MIKFILKGNGTKIKLPINPKNFSLETENNNQIVNVVGIGDIVIPGSAKLTPITIESYFPAFDGELKPHEYVEIIKNWQLNETKVRLNVTDINQESILTIIESFEYDRRAGEHEDIYYTLQLIEYRQHGAKLVPIAKTVKTKAVSVDKKDKKDKKVKGSKPSPPQRTIENKPVVNNTYKIVGGDSLWKITKKFTGDGARWKELYSENKAIVGNNPNLIHPGTVLNIPQSWVSR